MVEMFLGVFNYVVFTPLKISKLFLRILPKFIIKSLKITTLFLFATDTRTHTNTYIEIDKSTKHTYVQE